MLDIKKKSVTVHILESDSAYLSLIKEPLKHPAISSIEEHTTSDSLLNADLANVDIIIIDTDIENDKHTTVAYEEGLRKLKDIAINSKIIIISSKTDAQLIINLFKVGVVDYILKNENTLAFLTECIDQLIAYCQLNKQYAIAKTYKRDTKKKLTLNIIALSTIILAIIFFKLFVIKV